MSVGAVAREILRASVIPEHVALALRGSAAEAISANPHLSTEFCVQWLEGKKTTSVKVARNLCRRPFTAEQVDRILAAEWRVRPLLSLLEANAENSQAVEAFLSAELTSSVRAQLVHMAQVPPLRLLDNVEGLQPHQRLILLNRASPEELSTADLVGHLAHACDWDLGSHESTAFAIASCLAHFRADFVSEVLSAGVDTEWVNRAIASSPWISEADVREYLKRDLRSDHMFQLVRNPWVSPESLPVNGGGHTEWHSRAFRDVVESRTSALNGYTPFTVEPWNLPEDQFYRAWSFARQSTTYPPGRPFLLALLAQHQSIPGALRAHMQVALCHFPDVVHGADWALTPARDTFASSYPEHARGSQPEPSWNEFADRAQRNQRVRDALSGTVNADDQARIDAVLDSPVCGYFGEYWVVDAAMEQFSAQVGDSTEAWVFVSEFAGSLDCTLRELASLAVKVSSN